MKILLTIHNLSYKGGGERVVTNLANEFCKIRGYEVCIMPYYTDEHNLPFAYDIDPRVKVEYLHNFYDIHEKERGIKRILWRWSRHLLINLRLNKKFKDYDIVIESHLSMLYPRFKTKHTKYIKIMHMVIHKWKQKNKYYNRIVFLNQQELERWQPYSDRVIKIPNFPTQLPFDDIVKKIPESSALLPYENTNDFIKARILLAQYFTKKKAEDLEKYSSFSESGKQKTTETQRIYKLIAIGRMEAKANHKGFPRLIQAYSKIAKDFPQWRLEIIGDDCGQKGMLQDMIEKLCMQNFIMLKPFTPHIESIYLESDIFVMSSHSESLPMVLIEASSFGLPLVAYDIVTIRDCFDKNGILVPNNDEEAFCNALSSLMQNERKRIEMGQQGINFVKQKFSKEVVIRQWINLFQDLQQEKQ
ncbi:hypothetical protein CQA53_07455 [Helicobacter didelphidarum]|uniref:Glycosyl transferase family 1 domain-containing protein n=1 Tax=Helicobacter didelphidarum TaxID=2040648 RepID=A0A3D8IIB0_9HELI|nr:glycosyltransferase [Helicobacter didelphidarum]RDU64898.1 hypothetical protein CQA53_07455 [Helicobacter didelphidarum]